MNKVNEDTFFLGDGRVSLIACDYQSRMASISVIIPCCLFQAVTPHVLSNGSISGFRIHEPVKVWLPQLTDSRFNVTPGLVGSISAGMNVAIREEIERCLKTFDHVRRYLVDPSDIIPMLPLGVYIQFDWNVQVDTILKVMENINNIKVVGIIEFQAALASILTLILQDFEVIDRKRLATRP
jgi:hypothetical protein